MIDVEASLMATTRQNAEGAVKVWEDLARYEAAIAATRPEIIIECGTWLGGSAIWFANHGIDVITIDVDAHPRPEHSRVTWLTGDTVNVDMAVYVASLTHGWRTMVVLDSAHDAAHVRREIELYGPLVTPGCHLVVEDGIARWMNEAYAGSPLDAIEELLMGSPDWVRDVGIEALHPVSMHPAGWWIRKGPA